MKQKLLLLVCLIAGYGATNAQDLPANPTPGKCYVKCITKDTFKEVTDTYQSYPSYTTLEVVPATYKTVEERVLVKEASKRYEFVPAVYETVEVSYVKKEGRTDLNVVPATFGTDSKTYETYPKTSGWEYKILEDCPSVDKNDCVSACFVEYPAQFREVSFTTLASDANTTSNNVPEQTRTYTKRVVKTPARVNEIEVPAEYATIKRLVVDTPAKTVPTTVDSKSKSITRTVLDKKGNISAWEEVDCGLLEANVLPIYYELGSARLTNASKKTIDETLLPLMQDSRANVEIMSHTDSRGNDSFNQSLSQQRAQSVVNYLVNKGISRDRLSARGYGETRLKNRCANGVDCSEAQHQQNRRTEFRVVNAN
ncbi:MAG: OmpA family protein [Winogradskyella sp.]|uniref:OmpA family protein n=1 Tax=Winogradskyella sp. TaxID=1883156 RepID=UPI000F3BF3A9|nr:OmpA family protein [Winogradskyella sp.]RNC86741.1 MAG: OmpA family protein [Winogradskyella sp.]